MRRLAVTILFLVFPTAVGAAQTTAADFFIHPTGVWNITTQHGEEIGAGVYHMGVDAAFDQGEGGAVYAVADGVVREVRERTQFGLVILVEHTLPGGKEIVSLYGHLRASDPAVSEGEAVVAGQLLGYLGNASENGGWSPHIHFGIHKEEYTGVWKYAGHVTNPDTVNDWYEPVAFIADRLTEDNWSPTVAYDFSVGQIVSDTFVLNALPTDIGSGVVSVEVEASDDGRATWEEVASYAGEHRYPTPFYSSLVGFGDGRVYLRVTAADAFGNTGSKTTYVRLKAGADTTALLSAVRGGASVGRVYMRAQNGDLLGEYKTTNNEKTASPTDVAVGDVTGNESKNSVMIKKRYADTQVVILSKGGSTLGRFTIPGKQFKNDPRVAVGDVDADGVDEIIVGSGAGGSQQVRVYERDGTLLWKRQPFKKSSKRAVDVAAGDMNGDDDDEVIVGMGRGGRSKVVQLDGDGARGKVFRAFGKKYKGGVNVATGDVDADGVDEIIVGSGGGRTGEVLVVEPDGTKLEIRYTPFGKNFTGPVDVSTTDWEQDGKAEVMVSQAAEGEAWVKVYRFTKKKRVVFTQRIFEEGFEEGARIAGW